jgi:hypothetical protein
MSFQGFLVSQMKNVVSGAELLLDAYPSTLPCFNIRKKLLSSFSDYFIKIVKDDGSTYPSEFFEFDGVDFPSASILSFLGTDTGLVEEVKAHNVDKKYVQTTRANMPIIAEGGVINTNANGPCLKFAGNQFMTIPASQAIFNVMHTSTPTSQYFEYSATNLATQFIFGNMRQSNRIGTYFAHNVLAFNNRLTARVQAPAGSYPCQAFNQQATSGINEVFNTLDIQNETAANRAITFINGIEYKTNTASGVGGTVNNAADTWHMGKASEAGLNYLTGNIANGIFWESDQSANRSEIITLINS